jgi:hypothetical protein
MTKQFEADGWCAWHPEKGWQVLNVKDIEPVDDSEIARHGWCYKPVKLISPAEYARLVAVSSWAKEVAGRMTLVKEKDELCRHDFIGLVECESFLVDFRAITQPNKADVNDFGEPLKKKEED